MKTLLLNILDDISALIPSFENIKIDFRKRQKKDFIIKKNVNIPEHIFTLKEFYQYISLNEQNYQFIDIHVDNDSKNLLSALLKEYEQIYLAMHINKLKKEEVHNSLKKKLAKLYEEKISTSQKGILSTGFLDHEIQDIKKKIDEYVIQADPYMVTLKMSIKYEADIQKLKMLATIFNVSFYPLYFKQLVSLQSFFLSPVLDNEYSLLSNLAVVDPFPAFTPVQCKGIFIGHEMNTQSPIFEDFFGFENFNSVIMAKSGAGKSLLASMLMKRLLFEGIAIVVFDPEKEYESFCNALHGKNYYEEDMVFIDAYMQNSENISYFLNLLPLIFESREDGEEMFSFFHDCRTYSEIKEKIEMLSVKKKNKLLRYFQSDKKRSLKDFQIINFVITSDKSKIDLYKIIMYCMNRNIGKTILFIDEAHKVMDDEYIAQIVRQVSKRGRKHNLGICVISQDIIDFVQNKWSKAVISNATFTFLLKQELINLPLINKIFGVEDYEDFLLHARVGEGIFMRNGEIQKVIFDKI